VKPRTRSYADPQSRALNYYFQSNKSNHHHQEQGALQRHVEGEAESGGGDIEGGSEEREHTFDVFGVGVLKVSCLRRHQ